MAIIINFQTYIKCKKEEQERIKKISILSSKKDNITSVLGNMEDSISVTLVTNHIGDSGRIIKKENFLGNDLLDVIIAAINQYKENIQYKIVELEKSNGVI